MTSVRSGTTLSLTATATGPAADAAHDGDILIGTADAGTTLLVSNVWRR